MHDSKNATNNSKPPKAKPCAWLLPLLLLCGGGAMVGLYFCFDPAEHFGFLRCPFRALTGLSCPCCGAQRALHQLLHGRLLAALRYNYLLPLPLLWALSYAAARRFRWERLAAALRSTAAHLIGLAVCLIWLLLRNYWGV